MTHRAAFLVIVLSSILIALITSLSVLRVAPGAPAPRPDPLDAMTEWPGPVLRLDLSEAPIARGDRRLRQATARHRAALGGVLAARM